MKKFFPKGYTLFELVIYVALAAVILLSLLWFTGSFLRRHGKEITVSEGNQAGVFVMDLVNYYGRRADMISPATVYDSDPGSLVLFFVDGTTATFNTYQKTVDAGGVSYTIRKLQLRLNNTAIGGSDTTYDITTDRFTVTSFVITDVTGTAESARVSLTIDSLNPSNDPFYDFTSNWTTTLTPRSR